MIEEIEHHPIMKNFKPWEGKCDSDFVVDFLGVFTRKDYIINSRKHFHKRVEVALIVVTTAIANLMGICTSTCPNDRGQF